MIVALCAIASIFTTADCFAQSNKYAEPIAKEFKEADTKATPAQPSAPIIAIPVIESAEWPLFEEVRQAGGVPVAIFAGTLDFPALRDAASSFDGFIYSKSFRANKDLNLLKAVIDRNVPIYGSDELLVEINAGLKRLDEDYPSMEAFISQAKLHKRAKQLMSRIFSLDTHNDQPCRYDDGAKLAIRMFNQVSLPKMVEGYVDGAFIIDWISQKELEEAPTKAAMEHCNVIFNMIHEDAAANSEYCGIVRNEAEARAMKASGKKALFIGIENSYGLGKDLDNIRKYRDRGMTYMTLCHTGDNYVCHTSSGKLGKQTEGLTEFGEKFVKELNDCGVIIDLSHASEQSFWDAARVSRAPIVCTHSGAMAVHAHDRNLTDDQLRELSRNGGVIQIFCVSSFMSPDRSKCTIDDIMKHLVHCVEVAGIDHVGIGTDFDGGSGAKGINGSNDCINLTMKLIEHGFSDEDIAKIWGGNFFRVMAEVQSLATK